MEFLSKDQFIDAAVCDVYCEPHEAVAIRLYDEGAALDDEGNVREGERPFHIDGISADGVYTEAVWNFETKQEALDAIYQFSVENSIPVSLPVQDMTSED